MPLTLPTLWLHFQRYKVTQHALPKVLKPCIKMFCYNGSCQQWSELSLSPGTECSCHNISGVTAEAGTAPSPGAHSANSPLVFLGRGAFGTNRTRAEWGKNRYACWLHEQDLAPIRFNLQVSCLRLLCFHWQLGRGNAISRNVKWKNWTTAGTASGLSPMVTTLGILVEIWDCWDWSSPLDSSSERGHVSFFVKA